MPPAPPKRTAAVVKIQIEAGKATPAPPVGTALGPHGVAITEFCKEYNARTENQRGQVIPAVITIYEDRSFEFITKTPPTSFLIKQALGIDKGASEVGRETAGTLTVKQIEEIAKIKMPDLNTDNLRMAKRQIVGTARSMGVSVGRNKPSKPSPTDNQTSHAS